MKKMLIFMLSLLLITSTQTFAATPGEEGEEVGVSLDEVLAQIRALTLFAKAFSSFSRTSPVAEDSAAAAVLWGEGALPADAEDTFGHNTLTEKKGDDEEDPAVTEARVAAIRLQMIKAAERARRQSKKDAAAKTRGFSAHEKKPRRNNKASGAQKPRRGNAQGRR